MKTESIIRPESKRSSLTTWRTLGVFALCAASSLSLGCPAAEEPSEDDTKDPPVILFNNAQDAMDMGDSTNAKTPTDMSDSPDMSSNNMTPLECSVGERCGEECVDTNSDQANCGACGKVCADGAACQDGACFEQTEDCRQEACKGFFYCNLADGECLEGCDKDEQCNANSSCDVFSHECVCDEGFHGCAGQCVDSTSPQHCGDRCEPCPSPANGSGTCNADGTCGIACDAGYHQCGDRCVADDSVDHCGNRCEPCPTDPSGTAVCSSAGQCEIQCDSGFRDCQGACAACPADATNTACSGSACIASSCPGGTLLCDGQCSTCPTDPGATQLTCSPQQACVIQSCQNGLELCGNGCKQCPTQNVVSASCNASGECAIEACTQDRHPCGDSCCQWSATPTLVTKTDAAADLKLVRDANTLSLSFSKDGSINSYSHGEHWLLNQSNNSWSKAHQYEFEYLQGYHHSLMFGFREGSQNYALFLDGDTFQLVTPSGQDNWTVRGSVQDADEYSAGALRGDDDFVYITAENPQTYAPEMYKVTPNAGTKFSKLNMTLPQEFDTFTVNKAGEVSFLFDDRFGSGLLLYKKNGSGFLAYQVEACNSYYSYFGDFSFVVDAEGLSTILRVECDGEESEGLWATTEVSPGQWVANKVTSVFDGSSNLDNSDQISNLVIAPDGTLHACLLVIENQLTEQTAVYHAWRASDQSSSWNTKKVHTGTDIRDCAINTTSDSVPHIVWYTYDGTDYPNIWAYYHLAPN